MYKNLGRFNDPKGKNYVRRFDELLDRIPTLTDPAEIGAAYRELNVLFMQHQPALPFVYRPEQFFEFSTRVWRGFPTGSNPFLPPQIPSSRMGTRILWHLTPAGDAPEPTSMADRLPP
jgi:peptide/nickel transport system substrate-binding protein